MFKLTTRTSLKAIRSEITDQFGINIDNDLAKSIREAHKGGCVVWDANRLVDVRNDVQISEGRIRVGMATYRAREWNR